MSGLPISTMRARKVSNSPLTTGCAATRATKRVLKDLYGSIVKDIENIRQSVPGETLTLALDQRLQYLAYRELKTAVLDHKARGGMLLLLGIRTGEVLALAVQPPFNPNNRADISGSHYRKPRGD